MYPIDCFDVLDSSKMEAVRYYIDLNKSFLKETAREEYEVFAEYLKGAGKEVMQQMSIAKTNEELFKLLEKIEKELPYAKELSKAKTFETKIAFIHRAFANVRLNYSGELKSSSQVLKTQRQMASEYDALLGIVGDYRDVANSYLEIKEQLKDTKTMSKLFAKRNMEFSEVAESIKKALEQKNDVLKEKRAVAFNGITEYYVKEQMHVLEQERAMEVAK